MPFIVATYVYASSQGQRTHSARTNLEVTAFPCCRALPAQRRSDHCTRFDTERNTAFEEMSSLAPNFLNMSEQQKFTTFWCPTQPQTAKIANRLIKRMFELRDKIDQSRNDINVVMPSD
jgi:hypothetical protein